MNPRFFSLLDMVIVGIPVIGFCIWQLISVNREIGRDKIARDKKDRASKE